MKFFKRNRMIILLSCVMLISCSFFESKEFAYKSLSVEEYNDGDFKFKEDNFAILGVKNMKYDMDKNTIYVPVYLSGSGGREFESEIVYRNDTLFLSVRNKPNSSGEITDEKTIYFLEYNISLVNDQNIKEVVFIHPNYKKRK